jgi:hypothetical protein
MSVLRRKVLIADTHLQDTTLREKRCENPRSFLEAQSGPQTKTLGKAVLNKFQVAGRSVLVMKGSERVQHRLINALV